MHTSPSIFTSHFRSSHLFMREQANYIFMSYEMNISHEYVSERAEEYIRTVYVDKTIRRNAPLSTYALKFLSSTLQDLFLFSHMYYSTSQHTRAIRHDTYIDHAHGTINFFLICTFLEIPSLARDSRDHKSRERGGCKDPAIACPESATPPLPERRRAVVEDPRR
jgi:hypothetical protein